MNIIYSNFDYSETLRFSLFAINKSLHWLASSQCWQLQQWVLSEEGHDVSHPTCSPYNVTLIHLQWNGRVCVATSELWWSSL